MIAGRGIQYLRPRLFRSRCWSRWERVVVSARSTVALGRMVRYLLADATQGTWRDYGVYMRQSRAVRGPRLRENGLIVRASTAYVDMGGPVPPREIS